MTSTYTPVVLSSFPSAAALTTTFTPPPACTGYYRTDPAYLTVVGQGTTGSCFPEGFATAATAFFSPGLVCPAGYHSACHDTRGVASITTVTCCPTRGAVALSCVDPSTLAGPWANMFCTWIAPDDGAAVPVTEVADGITSTATFTVSAPAGLNAFGVRMVYQSSDLAAASSSSNGPRPSSSPTAASEPGDGAGGLSSGTIIAIGVVVPVVILGAAVVGFFLWRRRRNQDRTGNAVAARGASAHANAAPETKPLALYGGYHETGYGEAHEAGGRPVPSPHTAGGDHQVSYELAGQASPPVELPAGSWR